MFDCIKFIPGFYCSCGFFRRSLIFLILKLKVFLFFLIFTFSLEESAILLPLQAFAVYHIIGTLEIIGFIKSFQFLWSQGGDYEQQDNISASGSRSFGLTVI